MPKLTAFTVRLVCSALILTTIVDGTNAQNAKAAETVSRPTRTQAPANDAVLTPEQARRALEVLQDDAKRRQTIEVLRAISGTQPATSHQGSTGTEQDDPARTVAANSTNDAAVAQDSLGAQMLVQASAWINSASENIRLTARTVTNFPLLLYWIEQTATDPSARDRLFDAALKMLIVFGGALVLEWLARFSVRKPIALLERRSELIRNSQADEHARTQAEAPVHRRYFTRTPRLMQRLPLAVARFALDLLPVLIFAVTGNLLLATPIGSPETTRLLVLAMVNAYVICQAVMCITRMLVLPSSRHLRLLNVRDETAAYVEVWVRRIVIVGVFGVATADVARLLGLYRPGYVALIRIVMLAVHLFVVIVILQCRRAVADWIRTPAEGGGAFALLRNRVADLWHVAAIFFVVALWIVWALRVQNGYALILQIFLGTLGVVVGARLLAICALGGLDRIFRISPDFAARFPALEARANRYYPVLRNTVSTLISIAAVLVLFEVWGIDALGWFESGHVGSRLISALATVAIAGAVALVIWEIVNAAIDRHIAQLTREARYARVARLRTLLPMLRTTLTIVIAAVVGLTALSEIGVNIAPLLAGAGIVGVAVGFGSQKLVQDLVTGLFLLLENAMQVGDLVTVSGLSGKVENLSLRTIRLRASDGSVHIIPFSAVTSVTNTNRGIGNASISINVAFKEDTDRVGEVLKEIGDELRHDPAFKHLIRSDLALWGVDKIDAGVVTILGQIECTDDGRWGVQREFNRRVKKRFQELGIEFATPNSSTTYLQPFGVQAEVPPLKGATKPHLFVAQWQPLSSSDSANEPVGSISGRMNPGSTRS
jgi:small-conductance mechanosensitive channel